MHLPYFSLSLCVWVCTDIYVYVYAHVCVHVCVCAYLCVHMEARGQFQQSFLRALYTMFCFS